MNLNLKKSNHSLHPSQQSKAKALRVSSSAKSRKNDSSAKN
jgi:hypothetical protein